MKISTFFWASVVLMVVAVGCSSTSSEWGSGEVAGMGVYSAPPQGITKKQLAVYEFEDKTGSKGERGLAALDQMTTLMFKSKRFKMIERGRLETMLKEQDLEGVVRPGGVARPCNVQGVDLICFGAITDFEVKKSHTESGGGILRGIGKVAGVSTGLSVLEIDFEKDQLDFHIGVDVRIVDPSTGEIHVAESADMRRTETAEGMGLSLVGLSVGNSGSIEIDNENQGRLLRLALHEVVTRMLPEIDGCYENDWK